MTSKRIIVFPTWILLGLLRPLLTKGHPWKGRRFSLSNWSEHATELTVSFGIFFWFSTISTAYVLVLIFTR